MNFLRVVKNLKNRYKYSTNRRGPFYDLAIDYLPKKKDSVLLDIGCGDGSFVDRLHLLEKYVKVWLLDDNKEISNKKNGLLYTAPDKLPFDDLSVDFIHCSHMIEHLNISDFFSFLKEIDRVLSHDGVLVISAPLLNYRFYEEFTHVKPYGPGIFEEYMCHDSNTNNVTGEKISRQYKKEKLIFRYHKNPDHLEWGSKFLLVDMLMKIVKKTFSLLGFIKFEKNGYTIVLRKK
jgi:predicted SAM-dependent methyltransferase